jgi:hypothetical protein
MVKPPSGPSIIDTTEYIHVLYEPAFDSGLIRLVLSQNQVQQQTLIDDVNE